MIFNFTGFYNYYQLDNTSLVCESYFFYSPEFNVNFSIPCNQKLLVLQAFDLLYQFFQIRPVLKSVEQFEKVIKLNISLSIKNRNLSTFFHLVYRIRSSSKFKLIKFKFSKSGHFSMIFNDFTTLFPFKIKFFDFHTWRNIVSISSSLNNIKTDNYKLYLSSNFSHTFFRNIYYGQI
jgi:hypothetical protein